MSTERVIAKMNALAAKETKEAAIVVTEETKISVLWRKVKPYWDLLTMIVPTKIKKYFKALSGALDTITATEEGEEAEDFVEGLEV